MGGNGKSSGGGGGGTKGGSTPGILGVGTDSRNNMGKVTSLVHFVSTTPVKGWHESKEFNRKSGNYESQWHKWVENKPENSETVNKVASDLKKQGWKIGTF